MTDIQHPAITAQVDELRDWRGVTKHYGFYNYKPDALRIWREYNQRLVREATRYEPEEYTEEQSEYLTVKIENDHYVIYGEEGELFFTTRMYYDGDSEEGFDAATVEEVLDARIPYRDLEAEYEEAYNDDIADWL